MLGSFCWLIGHSTRSPVVHFSPLFLGEGSPTKIVVQKKVGTLTSNLSTGGPSPNTPVFFSVEVPLLALTRHLWEAHRSLQESGVDLGYIIHFTTVTQSEANNQIYML